MFDHDWLEGILGKVNAVKKQYQAGEISWVILKLAALDKIFQLPTRVLFSILQ